MPNALEPPPFGSTDPRFPLEEPNSEAGNELAEYISNVVYPRWQKFQAALPVFTLPGALKLHVVPFDLDRDELLLAQPANFLQINTSARQN